MKTLLEILFTFIKMIVVVIAIVIELPIKVASIALFLAIFIVAAFFAPLFSKIKSPEWWDMLCEYCMHPFNFVIYKWVNHNYDY